MNKFKQYFNRQRLVLIIVVAFLYGNTLRNGYSIDDGNVTEVGNITSQGVAAIPKIIKSYYIERAKNVKFEYRPVVKIVFAIEHELFGVNAAVSHFFNLIFYIVNLLLLLSVLTLMFPLIKSDHIFYCVLIFAILPIHTEVVASIKNRDILICFALCIIALKRFLLFSLSGYKKLLHFILASVALYLAFLSKLDALPFLAIIPVLLSLRIKMNAKILTGFALTLLIVGLCYKLTKHGLLDKFRAERLTYFFENPLYFNNAFKLRLIATFNCLGFYLAQLIYPIKQSCYYGAGTISVNKLNLYGYFALITSPVIIYATIKTYITKNYFLFAGLFIFCACISMYLNLITPVVGIVADRFPYSSSFGFAIIIVASAKNYLLKTNKLTNNLKIACTVVGLIFTGTIIARNRDWKGMETLVHADYKKYPDNAFLNFKEAQFSIAQIEKKNGAGLNNQQQKNAYLNAKSILEKSISVDPNYIISNAYLCYVMIYLLNDFKGAMPQINRSLKIEKTAELYFYKGICFRETGQADSSEQSLKNSIEADASYFNPYNLLMFDYNAKKQYQKSIDMFNTAVIKGANTVQIQNGLGKTYWEMGNNPEAKKHYQNALDMDAANQEAAAMVKHLSK